ncbi:MAG: hypothetical protein MO853_05075 [Candidatus Protistobacter heckmanni]|nr:hypothetical protein [Candidatus Protistobacter heckmanni]
MLQEPRNQHRASAKLQEFITRNYMFAAHLAALRLLLQRRGGELDMPLSAAQLREANASVQAVLTSALTPFAAGASAGAGKTNAPEVLDDNWSAARLRPSANRSAAGAAAAPVLPSRRRCARWLGR